jgi:phosphoribosylamine--glycine ligase
MMKVLVIGQGGREHCLVHALTKSKRITKLLCGKGNAGISQIATCVDINADNIEAVVRYVRDNGVD